MGYSIITDYSDCVSQELTFEFKEDLNLFIIDDSDGEHKYSSMNFPYGEHYICIEKDDQCIKDHTGYYYQGWKLIPLKSKSLHLTGKYKTNVPNFILGAFAPDTSALQAEIEGKKVWLSYYELDEDNLKKTSLENIKALYRNTKLINGWLPDFKCPNKNVKEKDWKLKWFN